MNTEKFYYTQPKCREVQARVMACSQTLRSWEILLDRTIFYPEGG